ncbi:MAG: HAMP domain-containing protein, partial [Chloroflexi bacterium]|nr:HAMP domain-containing protein [Chloroflexota bacterium]
AFLGYVVAETTLEIGAPIQVDGETVGYLYSGSYIENVLSGKENQLIVINQSAVTRALLFGLLIGFLLSILLTLALLRPIRLTIDSVKRIAQGDLRARVSLEPYGDMAELGQALNDMAAELEKSQQIQQLMVMDIAHDLRTPLSVQRAAIEAFEDGVYKFDQNGLNLLKIQNTHLIHLVEDLRLLALPDAGVFQIHREKIDLRTFIQDILYNFETVFTKKDIQVDFNPYDDGYVVDIDPHLMQRVFENLLQNAYQHSPTGGLIEIRIQRKINRMAVVISNQGPGIPEEKLETIFKRYYRIPSVEKGTAEGLGLGLAISKRIVDGHGGTLYAQNSREGGAEFVLELPYPA